MCWYDDAWHTASYDRQYSPPGEWCHFHMEKLQGVKLLAPDNFSTNPFPSQTKGNKRKDTCTMKK